MADLNVCTIQGRLTRDAEQRATANSTVTTFDIANNTGFGEYKKVMFIKVDVWGKRGTALLPYLKKGTGVIVTGSMQLDSWTDRNGMDQKTMKLNANDIILNGGPKQEANQQEQVDSDDIPF